MSQAPAFIGVSKAPTVRTPAAASQFFHWDRHAGRRFYLPADFFSGDMGPALLKLLLKARCPEFCSLASIGHKTDTAAAAGMINIFQAVS